MKTIIPAVIAAISLLHSAANAQTQGIAYPTVGKGVATTFVTDYHSLGINSSTLGWGNKYSKSITTGITESSFGMYSDSLNVDKLKSLWQAVRSDWRDETSDATWEEQRQNAIDYMNSGIAFDANFNWLGFSYQNEKFGGIAFSINESYNWYSQMNEDMTDLIFRGRLSSYFDSLTVVFGTDTSQIVNHATLSDDTLQNVIMGTLSAPLMLSQLTSGSSVKFTWNRYYNVGYGRKLFGNDSTFALYGGIGGRFIQSMAMFDMESDANTIKMFTSYNPNYEFDYGAIANFNPSDYTVQSFIPKPVGSGYGVDLSVSTVLFGNIRVAAAVNNIGSVTYTRNVYTVQDTLVGQMSLAGLDNANLTNAAYSLLEDGGIVNLVGQEKYVVKNASNYRFGASMEIGEFTRFGFDVVGPFNPDNPGSLANPVISVGGDIRPLEWLYISAGYLGGGIYKHNIPLGINFVVGGGTYEFGISSRDALSFIVDGSNSISTAFGFVRFRF